MTLQELAQELIAQASGPAHEITLDNLTLERSGVNELIQKSLARVEGNLLLIANPDDIPPDPPPTGFSFECLLPPDVADSFLNLTSNNCTISFTQDSEQQPIQFSLSIKLSEKLGLPATWQFGDSFPLLALSPYSAMNFTAPLFIFTTTKLITPDESFDPGLNFTSPLTLTGPFSYVSLLLEALGKSGELSNISGTIQPNGIAPTIDINAQLGLPSLSLFVFALLDPQIGTQLSTPEGPDGETLLNLLVYLRGTVALANNNGVEVQLQTTALLNPGTGIYPFAVKIVPGESFNSSLEQLGSLVGGQAWDNLLSGPAAVLLPFLKTFGLRSYSLWLTLNPLSLTLSQLQVGTLERFISRVCCEDKISLLVEMQ